MAARKLRSLPKLFFIRDVHTNLFMWLHWSTQKFLRDYTTGLGLHFPFERFQFVIFFLLFFFFQSIYSANAFNWVHVNVFFWYWDRFLVFDREVLDCSLSEPATYRSSKKSYSRNCLEKSIGNVPFLVKLKVVWGEPGTYFKSVHYSGSIFLTIFAFHFVF